MFYVSVLELALSPPFLALLPALTAFCILQKPGQVRMLRWRQLEMTSKHVAVNTGAGVTCECLHARTCFPVRLCMRKARMRSCMRASIQAGYRVRAMGKSTHTDAAIEANCRLLELRVWIERRRFEQYGCIRVKRAALHAHDLQSNDRLRKACCA
eukprot:6205185-Pleurochrysis_carterae.AAC.6